MTVSEELMPVDVQTKFDQFPATIKGAFVLRGADGNPHAVDLEEARVGRVPQGPSKPVLVGGVRVDVAPGRDLFVPFEVGIMDLDSGWYAVHSSVRVDVGRSWAFFSRAFSIPWPRDRVRRGTTRFGETVKAGRDEFVVESVEMRSDCAVVSWRPADDGAPTEGASVRLFADEQELEAVPAKFRPLGRRAHPGPTTRSVFYPAPRRTEGVAVILTNSSGRESERIDLPLG